MLLFTIIGTLRVEHYSCPVTLFCLKKKAIVENAGGLTKCQRPHTRTRTHAHAQLTIPDRSPQGFFNLPTVQCNAAVSHTDRRLYIELGAENQDVFRLRGRGRKRRVVVMPNNVQSRDAGIKAHLVRC